ncbi:MAG: hypothetical protein GDA47_02305 [Rhodospirillales bacterium]|nr:hypothetical protein [Rhodospirillales bacterium]
MQIDVRKQPRKFCQNTLWASTPSSASRSADFTETMAAMGGGHGGGHGFPFVRAGED